MSHFTEPETAVSYARARWEDGERRAERHSDDSNRRRVIEEVVDAIMHELEKRIGGTFTSFELALLHESSEEWCQRVAHEAAPDSPWAWDLDMVQGAAFHRYARRAADYQLGDLD